MLPHEVGKLASSRTLSFSIPVLTHKRRCLVPSARRESFGRARADPEPLRL